MAIYRDIPVYRPLYMDISAYRGFMRINHHKSDILDKSDIWGKPEFERMFELPPRGQSKKGLRRASRNAGIRGQS
jgi:hypothetical protein